MRTNTALYFVPRKGGHRVRLQIRFTPFKFLYLPIVNRDVFGMGHDVVPEVLDELNLLSRTQVEH